MNDVVTELIYSNVVNATGVQNQWIRVWAEAGVFILKSGNMYWNVMLTVTLMLRY